MKGVRVRELEFFCGFAPGAILAANDMSTIDLPGRLIEIWIGNLEFVGYPRIGDPAVGSEKCPTILFSKIGIVVHICGRPHLEPTSFIHRKAIVVIFEN